LNSPNSFLIIFIWLITFSGSVHSAGENVLDQTGEIQVSEKNIETILRNHIDTLMAIDGVVGIGQGLCNGDPCIKVFVAEKTRELEENIPEELDGCRVKIEETGPVQAYPE
jgi:hypothetical protein